MICETIKVKPWGKGQGDYVEINEGDFDPKFHKRIEIKSKTKNTEEQGNSNDSDVD